MAGRSSLRKIVKIVVTRCHILKVKCRKFDFGFAAGELTALHSLSVGFKEAYF